jgi:hypothetical protein
LIQAKFQVYYDAVMPYLKAILVNATDKSNRMLRAKAIECVSLVGMAVGKEKFGQDAKQVHYYSLEMIRCLNSEFFSRSHSFFYEGYGAAYESSRDPPR